MYHARTPFQFTVMGSTYIIFGEYFKVLFHINRITVAVSFHAICNTCSSPCFYYTIIKTYSYAVSYRSLQLLPLPVYPIVLPPFKTYNSPHVRVPSTVASCWRHGMYICEKLCYFGIFLCYAFIGYEMSLESSDYVIQYDFVCMQIIEIYINSKI